MFTISVILYAIGMMLVARLLFVEAEASWRTFAAITACLFIWPIATAVYVWVNRSVLFCKN